MTGELTYKVDFLQNKIVREKDINVVINAFQKSLTESKFQSYGKRSYTDRKVTVINEKMFEVEADKESTQIYRTRSAILRGQTDTQTVAVEDEATE